MPPNKRSRACDACHSIKIKCELGSSGGDPPCERCTRLGKEYTVSPPKRQKDRVAELEAQVAALTRQLESHSLRNSIGQEASQETLPSKKRRLDKTDHLLGEPSQHGHDEAILALDNILSISLQKKIYHQYTRSLTPVFEVILSSTPCGYDEFRNDHPWLLTAIIYAACNGIASANEEDQIAKVIITNFVPNINSKIDISLEIIQALQMITMWYRIPKQFVQIEIDYFPNLTSALAGQIGIPNGTVLVEATSQDTGVVCRVWLVCHLLAMNISNITRRRAKLSWGRQEENALLVMEYSTTDLARDRLVAQYVRGERLCEKVAAICRLFDQDAHVNVADADAQLAISNCFDLIADWKAQIPPDLIRPALQFWEYTASIFATERVLYTLTNSDSFTGPYVAERLSITDFPAPLVQQEHVTTILILRDSCHALLDVFLGLDVVTLTSLPPIIFLTRALYAQWLLIKIWIALTGNGNSLGAYVDAKTLLLDDYLDKMIAIGNEATGLYPTGITGRILTTSSRLKIWLANYRAMLSTSLPISVLMSEGQTDIIADYDHNWNWYDVLSNDSSTSNYETVTMPVVSIIPGEFGVSDGRITFQAIFGAGVGASLEQCNTAIQISVPSSSIPAGTGLVLFTRSLAGILSLSIAQNVFIKKLERDLSLLLPDADVSSIVGSGSGVTDLVKMIEAVTRGTDVTLQQVLGVYNGAVSQTFVVAAVFAALSGLGALLVEWRDVRTIGGGKSDGLKKEGSEERAESSVAEKKEEGNRV